MSREIPEQYWDNFSTVPKSQLYGVFLSPVNFQSIYAMLTFIDPQLKLSLLNKQILSTHPKPIISHGTL